jgi:CDP-4-dehydro-6-deoxyglucose reductase
MNEFSELSKQHSNIFFHPVFSRETTVAEGIHKGYVHHVYESLTTKKQPALFYLCGWKNMVDEARERIAALGYDKKDIHLELYG